MQVVPELIVVKMTSQEESSLYRGTSEMINWVVGGRLDVY